LEWPGGVSSALLGLQIIIEVGIFMTLFVAVADTVLFRVGLVRVLIKKFRATLLIQLVYMISTIIVGTVRMSLLRNNGTIVTLWEDDGFVALSILRKFLAIPYYLLTLHGILKLGQKIYRDKNVLIQQVKNNAPRWD
jgi:hypothetical protein